jgi:hypothetical protein
VIRAPRNTDTRADVEDIRSGRKSLAANGQLVRLLEPASLDGSAFRDASAIATRNIVARAIRAEVNVGKALLNAEAELESDTQTPPESRIDDDWLFRWRDSASTVSSEELQNLLGRLLTSLGRQILKLGTFESDEAYLRSVGQAIRGQGFKVQIARFQPTTETEGRYFDPTELD